MLDKVCNKRVGILLGGNSSEREISLLSGNAIYEALKTEGVDVVKVDVGDKPDEVIKNIHFDIAFIALHGQGGEDGTVQRVLERLHIPYTGTDARNSLNAFNKMKAKRILCKNNIPVPQYAIVRKDNWQKRGAEFTLPVFIKPIDNGSSIGVYLINTRDELKEKFTDVFKICDHYMIEERIVGREITVGIVDERALPIIELKPRNSFYDYDAKYTHGKTEYFIPAAFPAEEYALYQELALRTHQVLGGRDFSRVDMMVDPSGNPYVLELNSIPGFTATSLLPKAARESGLDFGKLCLKILQLAMRRMSYGTQKKAS